MLSVYRRFTEAEEQLQRALRLNPGYVDVLHQLANVYGERKLHQRVGSGRRHRLYMGLRVWFTLGSKLVLRTWRGLFGFETGLKMGSKFNYELRQHHFMLNIGFKIGFQTHHNYELDKLH